MASLASLGKSVKCSFCSSKNATKARPFCNDCDEKYVLSCVVGFTNMICGHRYVKNNVKYYINPYFGRFPTNNINEGIWTTSQDGKYLERVENPPLPPQSSILNKIKQN